MHRVIVAKMEGETAHPIKGTLGVSADLREALNKSNEKFGAWVGAQAAERGVEPLEVLKDGPYLIVPAAPWEVE